MMCAGGNGNGTRKVGWTDLEWGWVPCLLYSIYRGIVEDLSQWKRTVCTPWPVSLAMDLHGVFKIRLTSNKPIVSGTNTAFYIPDQAAIMAKFRAFILNHTFSWPLLKIFWTFSRYVRWNRRKNGWTLPKNLTNYCSTVKSTYKRSRLYFDSF